VWPQQTRMRPNFDAGSRLSTAPGRELRDPRNVWREHMRKVRTRGRPRLAVAAGAALLAAGVAPLAHAVSFQGESGNWTLSWDTTVGYGQGWRLSRPDCRLIAIANGGCGYSPNIDDG